MDKLEKPEAARIVVADFCFFAGKPSEDLVKNQVSNSMIMIPPDSGWERLIEQVYGDNAERIVRYAIKKEPDVFDIEKLKENTNRLPNGYHLEEVNRKFYEMLINEEWSQDLCGNFSDYAAYRTLGMGVIAVQNGMPVAGASSYTVYNGGIEIEIDTMMAHRRKGLALACASKLILMCLEKGLYPSWDAHDLRSAALAEKLGYHMDREYTAYEVTLGGKEV